MSVPSAETRGTLQNQVQLLHVTQHVRPQPSVPRSDTPSTMPASSSTTIHQSSEPMFRPAASRIYHLLRLDEKIGRAIDEPHSKHLRAIFNYLGSIQSLMNFKRALCDLRARKSVDDTVVGGARSSADSLRIVKRLRENLAADSLLMMCHIVRLFEDDRDDLTHPPGSFMIQTQTSFCGSQNTSSGNPLNLAKTTVIDKKMRILYPHLVPGSEEYQVERQRVKRLRQSAAKFVLFCNAFGFGILAFLPYADPFGTRCHLNRYV